jgi:bifunctional non-homologous end joining protein LigD
VRLYSRPGNDLTHRFPLIVDTLRRLRPRSCIRWRSGRLRWQRRCFVQSRSVRHNDESIFLYAFDLIELDGDDLRRDPLEGRKASWK